MDEKDENILGIVQSPILLDSNKKSPSISLQNKLSLKKIDDKLYELTIHLDEEFVRAPTTEYPIRFNLPMELRREKQPDTPIYSGMPDSNRYLSNISMIGSEKNMGIGKSYIRFVLASLFQLEPKRIKSVKYYAYSFNDANCNLNLYEVLNDWCSLTTTWKTKIEIGGAITYQNATTRGEKVFDLTDCAKRWFADKELLLEHQGGLMQTDSIDTRVVISSNDNALYHNKTEIIFQ